MATPFTVNNRVGRLIEFRPNLHMTPDQMPEFVKCVREAILRPRCKVVIICDLRPIGVMHPEVAERTIEMLRGDNPLVERSGYVLNNQAIVGLHLERMVREAKNENRRTFRTSEALLEFLAPVLTAPENQRAAEFLQEWSPPDASGDPG